MSEQMRMLAMSNPAIARMLDEQERQKQYQQRVAPTNYGNDAMGRFLTAASGAQKSLGEGARSAVGGLMGIEQPMGMNEKMAVQADQMRKAEEAKAVAQGQRNAGGVSAFVNSLVNNKQITKEQAAGLIQQIAGDPSSGKDVRDTALRLAKENRENTPEELDPIITVGNRLFKRGVAGADPTEINPEAEDEKTFFDKVGLEQNQFTGESAKKAVATYMATADASKGLDLLVQKPSAEAKGNSAKLDERYTALNDQINSLDTESQRLVKLGFDIENEGFQGGFAGQAIEALKTATGTTNLASALRKEFIRTKNVEMLQFLPPGIASDKDVALVLRGLPDDFSNPEQASSYLRGMAKIKSAEKQYLDDKLKYMKDNEGSEQGFLASRREKALEGYNKAFKAQDRATGGVFSRNYEKVVAYLESGGDPIEAQDQVFKSTSAANNPNAYRDAQIIIRKLKLEGKMP